MDLNQARARVKLLVTEAHQHVAPDVPGEVDQVEAGRVNPCPPPATDKVAVSYSEHLPTLPADRYRQIAAAAKSYWQHQGYRVDTSDSPVHTPRVFARTQDGVDVSYTVVVDGSSWITADSPCVTPSPPAR